MVAKAGWGGGLGNAVFIQDGATEYGYGHNSELLVKDGDRVDAGQAIARAGNTGYSFGSHVHFEARGAVDLIVVECAAALVPQAAIKGDMGASHVGLQARLLSRALRKPTAILAKVGTTAIFINQVSEKIGVMYGNPESTPGGRALTFYASVRPEVRRKGELEAGSEKVENVTRVNVVKNKVAPPFREAEVDIVFGRGVDRVGDLINVAADMGLIEKSGSWHSYAGERLGQGKEKTAVFLASRPDLLDAVRAQVLTRGAPATTTRPSADAPSLTPSHIVQQSLLG